MNRKCHWKTLNTNSQGIERTDYKKNKRRDPTSRRSGGFIYGLLGVVVGALLVWFLIPTGKHIE